MASTSKKIYRANKEQALTNYSVGLNQFYSQKFQNKVNKDLKDSAAKDQFIANMRIRDQREEAKLEAFEKSEQRFIDQIIFNEQAEKIAFEGEERVFEERVLETAFQTDELNLKYQKQVIDSKYSYDESDRGIANAVTDFETEKDLIDLDFEKQSSQVQGKRKELDLRAAQNRSEANTQQYENRLSRIRSEGEVRASGRRGNSATRAVQSVQALSGVNAALIADRLTKSNTAVAIEREILDAQLNQQGQGFIRRSQQIQTRRAGERKTQVTENLKARQVQVAKALGVSTEQFNMNREQLGRSLLSAGEAFEERLKKIKRDRFAADLNAYAARQLEPKVQPEIPAPFVTPLPVLVKPPRPVKPVFSKNAGQIGANTNPVLQGISGFAGTVASIASVIPNGQPVAGVASAVSFGAQLLDKIF
tara:strand:- start:769 stop:2028 length:1260 start_codon:yes stop_codon:yes gene_type:complete